MGKMASERGPIFAEGAVRLCTYKHARGMGSGACGSCGVWGRGNVTRVAHDCPSAAPAGCGEEPNGVSGFVPTAGRPWWVVGQSPTVQSFERNEQLAHMLAETSVAKAQSGL
jgi:hypothetical protein